MCNSKKSNCSSFPIILNGDKKKKNMKKKSNKNEEQIWFTKKYTYKWNVSFNFGDQLFDFDLVAYFRFLSCKCGPIKLISTNGRNIPDAITHFKSFAATTENQIQLKFKIFFTSHFNVQLKVDNNHLPFTVTLCSPVPGCVNKSI